jgi:hypothetical protein
MVAWKTRTDGRFALHSEVSSTKIPSVPRDGHGPLHHPRAATRSRSGLSAIWAITDVAVALPGKDHDPVGVVSTRHQCIDTAHHLTNTITGYDLADSLDHCIPRHAKLQILLNLETMLHAKRRAVPQVKAELSRDLAKHGLFLPWRRPFSNLGWPSWQDLPPVHQIRLRTRHTR